MSVVKCESCGAPLTVLSGTSSVICEYCGNQTLLKQNAEDQVQFDKQSATDSQQRDILVLSLPSCGSSIFQKKVFNIHRCYAELVDVKSGTVDIHIDYINVIKRTSFLGSNIIFKLKDGKKISIKTMSEKSFKLAQQALDGLV